MSRFFLQKPTWRDVLLLSFFVVFVTYQPFLLHHEIIMMETGIHLPAINALFHGGVIYRDFFFLRGPFELYVPAFMMLIFGKNSILLPIFYYLGTVATMVGAVFLGAQLFRSRLILYLMIPILVTRTFPWVSFYFWGGMRYALGMFALVAFAIYVRKQKLVWLFGAGIISALALLTTVEAGLCTILAILAALLANLILKIERQHSFGKLLSAYFGGLFLIGLPYFIYLIVTGALPFYLDTTFSVATRLMTVFPDLSDNHFKNVGEFFMGLVPGNRFFRYMTPVFLYLFLAGYIIRRIQTKRLNQTAVILIGIAVYGILLYISAFRRIAGHHFEMALQPEKILLFFLLEESFFYLRDLKLGASLPKWKVTTINILFVALIMSSVGYTINRLQKRFPFISLIKQRVFHMKVKKLSLLDNVPKGTLYLEHAYGHVVPAWQEDEVKKVVTFLKENTAPNETIFSFPEVGNFSFWVDRPFVGRFPIATFSWLKEEWYQELLSDFKKAQPRYVVMTKLGHKTFPASWYFKYPRNSERFNEMTEFILEHYEPVESYESVAIYRRKS